MNYKNYVSKKIETKKEAVDLAKIIANNTGESTVIFCHKTNGYYAEDGTGGMIRNFEKLVGTYKKALSFDEVIKLNKGQEK